VTALKTAARARQLATYAAERAARHERKTGKWGWLYYLFAIPATVCATLATGSIAADSSKTVAGALAGAAAVLTGLLTILRAQEEASAHHKASAGYRGLQDEANLLGDRADEDGVRDADLREELKTLFEHRKELDETSPWMGRGFRRFLSALRRRR
jgi:hypothetical protein